MPTNEDFANYELLRNTGLCSCGYHIDDHAEIPDELKTVKTNCKLLKREVIAWHTPATVTAAAGR